MKSPLFALVKSDFIKLYSLRRTLLIFLLVLFILFLSPQMFSAGVVMLLYGSVFTLLAYDQSAAAYHWYDSLPVTRRQIFFGKYLFGILILLFSCPLMLAICLVAGKTLGKFDPSFLLANLSLGWFLGCFFLSLMLPLTLILGSVKARYFNMIIYIALFAGLSSVSGADLIGLLPVIGSLSQNLFLLCLLVPAGLILVLLSCFIGSAIYCRKEFIDAI